MYLLFKSVILIFIATFCECTALLDSLGRNLRAWLFFWKKVYKQRQSETFVLFTITLYQVSVLPALPSLPAGGELINS